MSPVLFFSPASSHGIGVQVAARFPSTAPTPLLSLHEHTGIAIKWCIHQRQNATPAHRIWTSYRGQSNTSTKSNASRSQQLPSTKWTRSRPRYLPQGAFCLVTILCPTTPHVQIHAA
ncbi:hypothetical protein VFPBJ_11164 [Purpureocillium lilacinum]|uniref:Uncharacterized protein n=1 Tax=Purpureocillium lilacinum TaxID=33203 RepID=A0A179FJB5_PURLI|nr:hypothetical protein VFPBJ_11164 [Purpureocillium lilacinum]